MLWWCIKILGREYPRRPSPLAELLKGSPQVVDVVADLLQFGPELRLQALALESAEPSCPAPLCLQSEALLLQLRDSVTDLSSPAHVLASITASIIARGLFYYARRISIHYHNMWIASVHQRGSSPLSHFH